MRKSTERLEIRLTPEERERIERKMQEIGIRNTSAYIRKMALDGYCINLDLTDVSQVSSLLRRCGNNLNQYAKKANETGSIYLEDIRDLQKILDEIWELHRSLLLKLAALK